MKWKQIDIKLDQGGAPVKSSDNPSQSLWKKVIDFQMVKNSDILFERTVYYFQLRSLALKVLYKLHTEQIFGKWFKKKLFIMIGNGMFLRINLCYFKTVVLLFWLKESSNSSNYPWLKMFLLSFSFWKNSTLTYIRSLFEHFNHLKMGVQLVLGKCSFIFWESQVGLSNHRFTKRFHFF